MARGKKTGGRQAGSKNKRTVEVLKTIEKVLGFLDETIEQDIELLTPAQRASMWNDLQEYIRPKLARTEHVGNDGKDLFPVINVIAKNVDKPE